MSASIPRPFRGITQPSYYFGRSVSKLLLFNIIQAVSILRRRGPSKKLLRPLSALKNSKSGQIALVLGNGPSLNKINIHNVKQHSPDIFAVNDYYMKEIAKELIPSFYCLSDPDTFIQPDRKVLHKNSAMYSYIEKHDCIILKSHLYRKIDLGIQNTTLYFNDREMLSLNRNINPLKIRGYSSLTILKALSVAIFLGYSKIYILGVDNTQHLAITADLENNFSLRSDKLYEDPNQEHINFPLSPPSGIAGKFQQYAYWFADFYKFPRDRIINLDVNSIIDYFPKSSEIAPMEEIKAKDLPN